MIVDPVWAVAEAPRSSPARSARSLPALLRCRDHPVPGVERAHRRGRVARQPARQPHARRRGAAVSAFLVEPGLRDPRTRIVVIAAAAGALGGRALPSPASRSSSPSWPAARSAPSSIGGRHDCLDRRPVHRHHQPHLPDRAAHVRGPHDLAARSRFIKDAGAAAVAAITVASFDRAAQSGRRRALAVAGVVGFALALPRRVDVARRSCAGSRRSWSSARRSERGQRVAMSGALALFVATVLRATSAAISRPVTSTGFGRRTRPRGSGRQSSARPSSAPTWPA